MDEFAELWPDRLSMDQLTELCPIQLLDVWVAVIEATSTEEKLKSLRKATRSVFKMTAKCRVWLHFARLTVEQGETPEVEQAAGDFLERPQVRYGRNRRRVSFLTRFQQLSKMWRKYRLGVLTASNFKSYTETIGRWLENPHDTSLTTLLNKVFGEGRFEGNIHTKYGVKNERKALEQYIKETRETNHFEFPECKRRGLCLYKDNPLVGGSPDGVMVCRCNHERCHRKWLIEIKCISGCLDKSPSIAAVERGLNRSGPGGALVLPQNHAWYYQILGLLGITGLDHCDLIIYTDEGIEVVPVDFNRDLFEAMMSKFNTFVTKCLYCHVLCRKYDDTSR